MIYLNLNLRNPWWLERFQNIRNWHGTTPFKNKFWEIQILKSENLFRFEFEFTIRQDHAGSNLELGFLGYEIHLTFYDNRHWNDKENQWIDYSA